MSIIDDIENGLELLEATAEQVAARLLALGDFGTAGPSAEDHPDAYASLLPAATWHNGWCSLAFRVDANPGRVGPPIDPRCVVDHTTDMHPDDWHALLNAWLSRPGDGACAHFLCGRDASQGLVQLMPIIRNGNHAGGPGHGVYVDATGARYHPNVLAVGIEFHCAGGQLRKLGGVWRFCEDGAAHGAAIPDSDVEPDPIRPGRGWHKLTPYQEQMRARLHAALDSTMHPVPDGLRAASTGETVPSWGVPRSARFVGHVSLDPTHRSDPWPNGMRALV